jgi:predicted extracellular nuclease
LRDLIDTLPRDQRYTYDFDGQSEVLDHILTSPAIHWFDYDAVHINAEFTNQTSDHDPQLVRIIPFDPRGLH